MNCIPIFNAHRSETGDWCGWSLEQCDPDETTCPANCPTAEVIDAVPDTERRAS